MDVLKGFVSKEMSQQLPKAMSKDCVKRVCTNGFIRMNYQLLPHS